MANKLELTWYGKENRIEVEPRLLLENKELSNCALDENTENMLQAISQVKTGQITYAVRDTRIDDKEIHEGDIMGIGDSGILAVGKDRLEVTKETIAAMMDDDSEVVSIYYGADTDQAEAEELASAVELYPDCDVEVNAGGQPIYYYVISVE